MLILRKRLFILLLFLTGIFSASLMAATPNFKLSAGAKRCVAAVKPYLDGQTHVLTQATREEFFITEQNGVYFTRGFLQVAAGVDEAMLKNLGVTPGTKAGDIWTVTLPLAAIEKLNDVKGVVYFESDVKVHLLLDKVREDVKINEVHQGAGLAHGYDGEGVIVGVIDQSFDFTQPSFRDHSTGNLRIKKLWVQSDQQGTPPVGYDYGAEYPDSAKILQKQYDSQFISHGTHVTGIAAGAGDGQTDTYIGAAPKADIVMVAYNGAGTNVIDAAKYIFDYAASVGKPAVINMSFGVFVGPRDGTSLVDKALGNLAGPGRIFVGAAGNSGHTPMHASHTFAIEETVNVVVDVPDGNPFFPGGTTVDVWGDVDKEFEVSFNVLDNDGSQLAGAAQFFATSSEVSDSLTLQVGNKTTAIGVYTKSAVNTPNHRANARIYISDKANKNVVLSVKATDGTVHIWNTGGQQGGPVSDTLIGGVQMFGFLPGDSEYTIAEIGGSGERVISVGAYTTKNQYDDYQGQAHNINEPAPIGERAPFSSIGPSLDGRVKPDITAPGNVVASALSSFDLSFQFPFGPEIRTSVVNYDNKDYPFGVYEGTSMASPVVTGVVALMLQANPDLTPETARDILRTTAREDEFTGDLPNEGTSRWGHGKINALEAVKAAQAISGVSSEKNVNRKIKVYPNPVSEILYILDSEAASGEANVILTDATGRVALSRLLPATVGGYALPIERLSPGVYFLRLQTAQNKEAYHTKVVVR